MATIHPISVVAIEDITRDPQNAYQHSDADIQRLYGVMEEYGFLGTLVVDEHLVLIGGEARHEVLTQLGHREVPVNIVSGLTPEERKALAISLNADFGQWNDDRLKQQLFELKRSRFDLDMTGLKPFEIERHLDLSQDKKLDLSKKGNGEGDPVLSYRITFQNDVEQTAWYQLARYFKERYPDHATLGERIVAYVAELGGLDADS